jgi:hypothetical protein
LIDTGKEGDGSIEEVAGMRDITGFQFLFSGRESTSVD